MLLSAPRRISSIELSTVLMMSREASLKKSSSSCSSTPYSRNPSHSSLSRPPSNCSSSDCNCGVAVVGQLCCYSQGGSGRHPLTCLLHNPPTLIKLDLRTFMRIKIGQGQHFLTRTTKCFVLQGSVVSTPSPAGLLGVRCSLLPLLKARILLFCLRQCLHSASDVHAFHCTVP